ncbi:hypothetical protein HPB50_012165 [Hyalomma asiaticum]|uniref:Uncharacterized protein n=1 Tax=Hyalomma asiaticum TaxID=266040 RepID=A0ACB7TJ09_HYAAI|nr:hypothetical protein HPB50_012165 [Hyalomma asiaticum]
MEGRRGAAQERRSAAHIEGRSSTRSAGSTAHVDDGTTASQEEEAAESEEAEHGPEPDDGAECSASAQTSRSRLVVSSQSSTGVASTVASSSLCDSQDVTSVTSLRASCGRGQRLSPMSYAERRRRALRIFWNMHKKTLLMALMVVSIISFITAATVNRRPAAHAHIVAAKPSEKDGSLVMDAPAVPTLHFTKVKSAFVSPGARGVSTPAYDEDGDDGAPAPVPTSVQTEATGDMSDAADKVEAVNEGASQSESEALESTRMIRRQHRRVPGASTSTRRRLREASTTQSDDEDDSSFGSRVDAPYVPDDVLHDPFGSLTNDRCGSVRYTFCPRLRREVFYNRQSGQCIAITTAAEHEAEKEVAARAAARYHHTSVDNDAAPLCNSSPNRFSSLESCRQSCQRSELPAERCFEKTIFSECRKYVAGTVWRNLLCKCAHATRGNKVTD